MFFAALNGTPAGIFSCLWAFEPYSGRNICKKNSSDLKIIFGDVLYFPSCSNNDTKRLDTTRRNVMKKTLLAVFTAVAALFSAGAVNGQDYIEPDQAFDIFQIGMLKGAPQTQDTAPVYGLRFGLPVCGGAAAVNGVDFAIIGSQSAKVNGFQYATAFAISDEAMNGVRISCVAAGKKSCGVEIAAVNLTEEAGVQVGAFNVAKSGIQFGVINIMENGFLPVMILFNFSL